MGDDKITYAGYPFKETPDKYLNDKTVLLLDSLLDERLSEVMELYMDSFFTRDKELYDEFKDTYAEFREYLKNHDNNKLVTKTKNYLISPTWKEYEFDPEKIYMESSFIELDEFKSKIKNKYPLYIVFNNSSHWFSKIITKMSKGDYSHVGLSFNGPDEIISFSMDDKSDGIKIENMLELISLRNPRYLKVVALPLDKETYKEIYQSLYKIRLKKRKYKYDLRSVLLFPFQKAEKVLDWTWDNTTFFCSQFVSWIIGNVYDVIENVNITPTDLVNKVDNIDSSITIFEGTVDDFNLSFFHDIEDNVRDAKSRIEKTARKEVEKLNLELKQESRLLKESSSSDNGRYVSTATDIIYRGYNDDEFNTKYNNAIKKIIGL